MEQYQYEKEKPHFMRTKKQEKKVCVLMGQCGSGKTTLYNKLCRTRLPAGVAVQSLTRGIARHDTCHGDESFSVIDTPGTDSKTEKRKHALLLKHSITMEPVNAIFVMVKYDDRICNMIENFGEIASPLLQKNYKHKIIVIVSKFDYVGQNEDISQIKKMIEYEFKQSENITKIIYSSKDTNGESLSDYMMIYMKQMEKTMLQYTEEDFIKGFNTFVETREHKELYRGFEDQIANIVGNYMQLRQQKEFDGPDKNELISSALIQSEKDINAIIQDFTKKFDPLRTDEQYFYYLLKLQKIAYDQKQALHSVLLTYTKIYSDDIKNPLNNIKKCQYCGEVWIKVQGCQNNTICGRFPSSNDEKGIFHENSSVKYQFQWINGQIKIMKSEMQELAEKSGFQKVCQYFKEVMGFNQRGKIAGCGQKIDWKNQIPLSKEELEELFQTKDLDAVIKCHIESQEYQELKQKDNLLQIQINTGDE